VSTSWTMVGIRAHRLGACREAPDISPAPTCHSVADGHSGAANAQA
jgi:hypothetical protein